MLQSILYTIVLIIVYGNAIAQAPPVSQVVHNKNYPNSPQDKSFIYQLPFIIGTKHKVVQAAYSKLSHKGEIALDFNAKLGTTICAARGGIVTAAYSNSKIGGLNEKYLNDGNHIIIQHNDGSQAMYWHLQYKGTLVNIGDTVTAGQIIGKTGNTGYTAFPHLHFEVNGLTANGTYSQLQVRFYTHKGIQYLRPLKKYKVV